MTTAVAIAALALFVIAFRLARIVPVASGALVHAQGALATGSAKYASDATPMNFVRRISNPFLSGQNCRSAGQSSTDLHRIDPTRHFHDVMKVLQQRFFFIQGTASKRCDDT